MALLSAFAVSEGYFVRGTPPAENNNPGDLDFANQLAARRAGRFAAFPTPGIGIAANLRQLAKDIQEGLSLRALCERWAPTSDGNNTSLYLSEAVRRVAATGLMLDPDRPLESYLSLEYIP